jgi:hypothetical protein
MGRGVPKHKAENVLQYSVFEVRRGKGSEKLYYLTTQAELIEESRTRVTTIPRDKEAA